MYLLKMVIFHSYVSLQEGSPDFAMMVCLCLTWSLGVVPWSLGKFHETSLEYEGFFPYKNQQLLFLHCHVWVPEGIWYPNSIAHWLVSSGKGGIVAVENLVYLGRGRDFIRYRPSIYPIAKLRPRTWLFVPTISIHILPCFWDEDQGVLGKGADGGQDKNWFMMVYVYV